MIMIILHFVRLNNIANNIINNNTIAKGLVRALILKPWGAFLLCGNERIEALLTMFAAQLHQF